MYSKILYIFQNIRSDIHVKKYYRVLSAVVIISTLKIGLFKPTNPLILLKDLLTPYKGVPCFNTLKENPE